MSAIHLIAADLDGTLLNPDGELAPRTRQALTAAAEAGVHIVLATARRYTGAAPIARLIGAVSAVVVYDGAQTRAWPHGAILDARRLNNERGRRAGEIMYAHGLRPIAQHSDQTGEQLIVGPQPDYRAWADTYLASYPEQIVHASLARLCRGTPAPLRVVAFGPLRRIQAAARAVAEDSVVTGIARGTAAAIPGVHVLRRGNYGAAELTVLASGVSKGAALARLARQMEVPLARIMAIGDGMNDVSMLRVAGLSVAMDGAPKALLNVADAVVASNAADGAADAIERFVLAPRASLRGDNADAPLEQPVRRSRELRQDA